MHMDIKGIVPPIVVNQAVASGAGSVMAMIDYIVSHNEDPTS